MDEILVVGRRYVLRNKSIVECIFVRAETAWMCDPNNPISTAYCWNIRSGASYSLSSEYDAVAGVAV